MQYKNWIANISVINGHSGSQKVRTIIIEAVITQFRSAAFRLPLYCRFVRGNRLKKRTPTEENIIAIQFFFVDGVDVKISILRLLIF